MHENVKYTIIFSLSGIVGLIIVDFLKDQNYLTWTRVIAIIVIAIIGSFLGGGIRNFFKKKEE